jgi:hypothetical protein
MGVRSQHNISVLIVLKQEAATAGLEPDLEARGGIEPPIKVLQTFALPLGDRASGASGTTPKAGPWTQESIGTHQSTLFYQTETTTLADSPANFPMGL